MIVPGIGRRRVRSRGPEAGKLAVVVPVHNRRESLELLLCSLERQTCAEFHVVVADDGSTDGTDELIEARTHDGIWAGRLRWLSCGPNQAVRTGRARNIGAANIEPATQLLVMLDSDLILRPEAIERFLFVHARHPHAVVLGTLEWLPPLEHAYLRATVAEGRLDELRAEVPVGAPARNEGTFVGAELRPGLDAIGLDEDVLLPPEWVLPLNSGWPPHLYWQAGGFDETMSGYGYQDLEFGARAAAVGARCVVRPDLWALHVWHSKPASAMRENQRNLDRYLRRHGPNPVIEGDIDWSVWWHYHAERGGSVVCDDGQLWALSADRLHRLHRLALPDRAWADRLGHPDQMPAEIPRAELLAIASCGTASE